jgi:hypothetical protein
MEAHRVEVSRTIGQSSRKSLWDICEHLFLLMALQQNGIRNIYIAINRPRRPIG